MTLRMPVRFLSTLTLLAAALGAQTPKFVYSPAGAELVPGGGGNTIPFWSTSGTYQQIHDYDDMVRAGRGGPIVMKAIGFRPTANATLTGRTWELQLNIGNTTVSSQNMSTTFSTNLGTAPKRVVGDQQNPFHKISFSSVTGSGTPTQPGVIIPFTAAHIYVPVKGTHFCWEWRHKNASLNTTMSIDAIQGSSHRGLIKPSVGTGCSGATSSVGFVLSRIAISFKASLIGAPASAKALMMVGLQKKQTILPGWCANLETVPLLHVFGNADSTGRWDYVAPMSVFAGIPTFEMQVQYAFADNRQPLGIGLSDLGVYQTPLPGAHNISRAYKSTAYSTSNGDETATTATGTTVSYGLVVAFQQ